MDTHHIIVEHLQNPDLLHIGADDLVQGLQVVGVGQGVGVQPLNLTPLLLGHLKGLGHVSRVAVDAGGLLHLGPGGLYQRVAGGRTLKDRHGSDGIMVMDDVRQLHQVVLAVAVIEIVVGKMAEIHIHGELLPDGTVIDAHAGHLCRSPGLVGIVGDDAIRRVGLGILQEVGQRIGRDHLVFEHDPSHTKVTSRCSYLDLAILTPPVSATSFSSIDQRQPLGLALINGVRTNLFVRTCFG